jgi:DNA-binding transcriptional ArsR family regulator
VNAYALDGLGALGDPTRRAIFELVSERPRPVGELADQLPISRPAVSQHLKVLKQAGLVVDRAEGTRRVYEVDPDGMDAIRAYFDRLWTRSLASFKATVEQQPQKGSTHGNANG